MSITLRPIPNELPALCTLLILSGVPFSFRQSPAQSGQMEPELSIEQEHADALAQVYAQLKSASVHIDTGIDSDEQGGHMNGTLSNLAPGLAVTLTVSKQQPLPALPVADAALLLQKQLLPLAVQGWHCEVMLGADLDHPVSA